MTDHLATRVTCPVCRGRFDGLCSPLGAGRDPALYDCETCGRFAVSREALDDTLARAELPATARALLAHRVRLAQGPKPPLITGAELEALLGGRLPTPAQQVTNLLRLAGDRINATGEPFRPDEATGVVIGAANYDAQWRLFNAVEQRGLLVNTGMKERARAHGGRETSITYDLTLDGWERYEAERRGLAQGSYGFIAMKFGEAVLDGLVTETIKPAVRAALNYEVVDLRDVARAGVIDNIMRAQIRDAAFVIVDLTHDNAGAYWEAGYAEGLGKPVVYICERTKFDAAKTHFDTNHCTTVIWDIAKPAAFADSLVATLRRSLNLFSDARAV